MKASEPEMDENALLADLKSGNEAAFKFFYDKYHILLYRRLLRLVQIDVIAEELLQDLFMKIWHKRQLIDLNQSFKSYLYRIAEHLVADYFRKLAREVKLERTTDVNEINLFDKSEETAQKENLQKIINDAINTLPAQQQMVFRLCKMEGKSYQEVSQLLHISQATINTHISRATKTVKAYVINHQNSALSLIGAYAVVGMVQQMM